MRKKTYITVIVLLLTLNAFSQDNLWYEKNFSAYKTFFYNEYGIDYTIPPKVKDLDKFYVLWKVRKEDSKHSGNMHGPIFLSKDKECILAYPANLNHKLNDDHRIISQISIITAEIKTSLGLYYHHGSSLNNDTTKLDIYDYVTIIAGKMAREMFNADSIFIYDLPNADSVYFFDESLENMRKEKYPYCSGMLIYKNNRPTMNIKFFFSEKGYIKRSQYFEMLSKHIWYVDK
jgi:hypothetical protein